MWRRLLPRLVSDHGMLLVLLGLCGYYSLVTVAPQQTTGAAGGEMLADAILRLPSPPRAVLIVVRPGAEDASFAAALRGRLEGAGLAVVGEVRGQPFDARAAIEQAVAAGRPPDVIATSAGTAAWSLLQDPGRRFPALEGARVLRPEGYVWPTFLRAENLLNVTNQIAIIAILAIGMTMVILTGGIDLSVGSLIALAAVVTALLLRDQAGGREASLSRVALCCAGGVLAAGLAGFCSGAFVTLFEVPPFIATLGVMLVASGQAWILAGGESINDVPGWLQQLDRGATLGLPNTMLLVALLYLAAHVVMAHTVLGRHVYAVGGNAEAARLAGVPVQRVLLLVYTASGLLAGVAGVLMVSRFTSGDPKFGQMYELTVIAAVVVGGTSLSGGEGKVFGTLVGAFLIGVIQNGMNLTGVEGYTQKVVLGAVILGAVLLDRLKRRVRWLSEA